jgi:hypothetical protein
MLGARKIAILGGNKFRDDWSLAFDGSDDYIDISAPFSNSNHSVVVWIKTIDDSNAKVFFDARDGNDDGIALKFSSAERIVYHLNSNDLTSTSGLVGAQVGDWIHVVATHNGTQQCLYINGVLDQSNTEETGPSVSTSADVRISGQSYGSHANPFEGNISEVAMYSSALTAGEVKTIYNKREPFNLSEGPKSDVLVSWYRMGDGVLDGFNNNIKYGLITDQVNPTLGADLFDAGAGIFTSGIYTWKKYGNNTAVNDSNTLKITYVDNADGAYNYLRNSYDLSSDLTVGDVYLVQLDAKVNTGSVDIEASTGGATFNAKSITNTEFETFSFPFKAAHATNAFMRSANMGSGEIIWLDNISIRPVNGNPGVMVNMDVVDFEGDTP